MNDRTTKTKTVLEVSPSVKDRLTVLAIDSETTLKDATAAILGWVLPRFESGTLKLSKKEISITE
jgi:hypothetical protein